MSFLARLLGNELDKPLDGETSYTANLSKSLDDPVERDVLSEDETLQRIKRGRRRKKKFRYGPRDSLRKRYHIGKEGSRRHTRYLNEVFLQTYLRCSVESEGEADIWDDGYDEIYEPAYGFFGEVFHDDAMCRVWEPFLEVTEEEQNKLLEELSPSDSEEDYEDVDFFSNRYAYMSRYAKQVIKQNINSSTIQRLDKELFEMQDESDDEKVYCFDDSYRRLLVHSLSEYYNYISYSKDTEDGDRITVVRKRDNTDYCEIPLLSLLS